METIRITNNYMSLTTDVFNNDGDLIAQYCLGTSVKDILGYLHDDNKISNEVEVA